MKIATFGLNIEIGKYKYACKCFNELVDKFAPKKATPYTVEFIGEDFEKSDAIIFDIKKKFDFVFFDIEKIERRLERTDNEKERSLLEKAQGLTEKEGLLCDYDFSEDEKSILNNLALVTYKPCLGADDAGEINSLVEKALTKAGVILFFTAGAKEVRAWDVKTGCDIVTAAGKIHSDLARGFIKADVVNCCDLGNFFNMAEARARGFVKNVGKEYIVQAEDIIEIKFSV